MSKRQVSTDIFILDGKKKLISITCDNCGFLIAPIEKEKE